MHNLAFEYPTDEKKQGRSDAEPMIPTLPEVKEHAAKALARAAKNGKMLLHTVEQFYTCSRNIISRLLKNNCKSFQYELKQYL